MSFRSEPAYRHVQPEPCAVLLVNLGTPEAATASALRRYLAQFLADRRVVELPRALWWLVLHGIVLRVRPARSAAKYRQIWTDEGSPLAVWTRRQAEAVARSLDAAGHRVLVRHAMRYGQPALAATLDELRREGVTRVLVLPLYPQYAAATTASVHDEVMRWALGARWQPALRLAGPFHDDGGYIDALASRVSEHWDRHGQPDCLLLSFHGLPRSCLDQGDPYHCHCQKTARLLAQRLDWPSERLQVTFQSRVGRAEWLQPYTEPTLVDLARSGVRRVDVICPGFVADCLETLEEIALEARDAFLGAGGREFHYIDCLNARADWIAALTTIVQRELAGWPTREADPNQAERRRDGQRQRALQAGALD